jgi:hypothetical protein
MKTCNDCRSFSECLEKNEVVVNVRGGDHICPNFKEKHLIDFRIINEKEFFVKAITNASGKIICGVLDVISYDYVVRDEKTHKNHSVSALSICKNSGIKDWNGVYVYEYDLLRLEKNNVNIGYGYLVWNDFYGRWLIRRYAAYSGTLEPQAVKYLVCGNVLLNSDDAQKIYAQDDEEEKRNVVIDNSYCPSRFKK